jgi:hypothetical protein
VGNVFQSELGSQREESTLRYTLFVQATVLVTGINERTFSSGYCFGGLVVSMLASGTQVRGFKLGRSGRIFSGEKILSMPSFGGEVKPSLPCRRFAACKRSLNGVEKASFRQNYRSARVVRVVEASGGESGNVERQGKAMANYP